MIAYGSRASMLMCRDEQAGQEAEYAGHGYGLAGLALTDMHVLSDCRKQADRREFGGDNGERAERQRENAGPGGGTEDCCTGGIGW